MGRLQGSPRASHDDLRRVLDHGEELITSQAAEDAENRSRMNAHAHASFDFEPRDGTSRESLQVSRESVPIFSPIGTVLESQFFHGEFPVLGGEANQHDHENDISGTNTPLATETVMDNRAGLPQDLTPFFTDPTGLYYKTFEKMLTSLNGKTSEGQLCIEQYIENSEKQWFKRLHDARMDRHATPAQSAAPTLAGSIYEGIDTDEPLSQFLLPDNSTPTGIRRIMLYQIGDWPLYSILLGLGQILGATSYQIVLLTGQIGSTGTQLYVVASIYIATTVIWWLMFRRLPSRWCLSLPWLFYGLAWFFLAVAPYAGSTFARGWVQNIAIGLYTVASSSSSLYFSQNFGQNGAVPTRVWAFRACAIQGLSTLYITGLWALGNKITATAAAGGTFSLGWKMTAIGMPIAALMWVVGVVLFLGLPSYYRQRPGRTPDFYKAMLRRRIIVWFVFAVFLQNIFLSAQYGRTWTYLWSSQHAPAWMILLLVLAFFVALWILILWIFSRLSTTHTWILPLFAVGLLCPRWAQEFWAVSGVGSYLPWAGSPLASALIGRTLFLWLG